MHNLYVYFRYMEKTPNPCAILIISASVTSQVCLSTRGGNRDER